jgi:hypothetical protein
MLLPRHSAEAERRYVIIQWRILPLGQLPRSGTNCFAFIRNG